MNILIILFLITSFAIKVDAQNKFHMGGMKVKINVYKGSLYFPTKGTDSLGTFTNPWYSEQLNALHEPILYSSKFKNEVYRFTWIRSFDPAVIVRIEKQIDGKYMLYWKQGIEGVGYPIAKNYKIVTDKYKSITKENWNFFQHRLKQLNFNKLHTTDNAQNGTDGAEWILEEHSGRYYHVTDRWSPNAGTDYYKCCDYILSLTDLKIAPGRKY